MGWAYGGSKIWILFNHPEIDEDRFTVSSCLFVPFNFNLDAFIWMMSPLGRLLTARTYSLTQTEMQLCRSNSSQLVDQKT